MVCIAVKREPVIGIIHKPFEHVTYWGWKGQNISSSLRVIRDGRSAKSSQRMKDTVIVSRSHPGEVSSFLRSRLGSNIHVIHAGGAGYKIIEVAKGNADAYIHSTLIKKWVIS